MIKIQIRNKNFNEDFNENQQRVKIQKKRRTIKIQKMRR